MKVPLDALDASLINYQYSAQHGIELEVAEKGLVRNPRIHGPVLLLEEQLIPMIKARII
jgi:hypothetical protein